MAVPRLAWGFAAVLLSAALTAFAAWAGGGLNLWLYHRATLGVPVPIALAALVLTATAFAAIALVTRVLPARGHCLLAALALPSGWTAFEHAVSRLSPHGTFGSVAYSQMDFLPVVQVASLVGISGITFLVPVCKDMDFPALGRGYARVGASMLLVPAWDFTADGRLHSRMAVLRGVEGGFAVARAARGGLLTPSDDRGRIAAEAASADAPVVGALGTARVGTAGTAYAQLGAWFAWLAAMLFALAVVTGARVRRAREVGAP